MSSTTVLSTREAQKVDARRLFLASCVALAGSAVMFAVLADIMNSLKERFVLSNEQVGWIVAANWGFTAAILVLGPLCDALGMRQLLRLAFGCQTAGVLLMIFASGFWTLFLGMLVHSIGSGTIEAVCNPLIATVYPDRKTQKLNQFHVWWPGGIVLGGLAAFALARAQLDYWQLKLVLVLIPALAYGILFIGQTFPATERVQAGISFGRMFGETFLRPLFLLLMVCMMMTASLELGPQRWIPSVLEAGGIDGILVLVWITGLMAVLRFVSGPVIHTLTNMGVLLASAVLSGVGLLLLSYAANVYVIGIAATIFALGVCYFWPTMLGTVAERVPRGGALALAVLGGTGNLFSSVVTAPVMGRIADHYLHRQLTAPDRDAETIGVLHQIDSSYRSWVQSLGAARQDQVTRADIEETLKLVDQALDRQMLTGTLPELVTADALRSALKSGPADEPKVAGPMAEAFVAKQDAKAILEPAENHGGLISFRFVAPLSLVLIVIFGAIYVRDHRRPDAVTHAN